MGPPTESNHPSKEAPMLAPKSYVLDRLWISCVRFLQLESAKIWPAIYGGTRRQF